MREIKFRLRDRHNKIVGYEKWYEGAWRFDNDQALAPTSGYWVAQPCWLYSVDCKKWTPTFIPHRYKDQYTGLKDKNGVEIYEGDIFKITVPPCESNQVVFDDGEYKLVDHRLSDYIQHGEVIGNIYENPELLEGKK